MQQETRKIQITQDTRVSSVFALPDGYPSSRDTAVILAHGAGNGMDHPFISHFHRAFAEAGLLSVKFNFPYMESGRKAPDRMPLLETTWRAVIRAVREDSEWAPRHLYLAGKSMGGRVASHVVSQGEACSGLIFLGYPLHPARQADRRRVAHWSGLSCPVLFVQGTRDALCDLNILESELPKIQAGAALHIIEGSDHSFKTPKSSGKSAEDIWTDVNSAIVSWVKKITDGES